MRPRIVWGSAVAAAAILTSAGRAQDGMYVHDEPWFPPNARACQSSPSLFAGTDLLYLKPYISNNSAFTAVGASSETEPFDWQHTRAHRIWIGYAEPSGWGVRAQGFVFDDSSDSWHVTLTRAEITTRQISAPPFDSVIPVVAGFGAPSAVLGRAGLGEDRLTFRSDLRIVSADVEATFACGTDDWTVRFSGGGRYLELRHGYRAELENNGEFGTSETQNLNLNRDFTGYGPTLALFARHRIGDTALSAYASARGSLVVGTLDEQATFARSVNDPDLLAGVGRRQTRANAVSSADHTIPVAELEMGLECSGALGRMRLFGRAGVVAQTYFNAGSATGSTGSLTMLGALVTVGFGF
ncbi:MAG TPA: Lpg1974 family pore-forming outer membrane protein [Gemmataceae bacterium]|nr:Lpg1974 family pore-forming outer membrane protein [Gemmataceae bacterium]